MNNTIVIFKLNSRETPKHPSNKIVVTGGDDKRSTRVNSLCLNY